MIKLIKNFISVTSYFLININLFKLVLLSIFYLNLN